MYIYIMYVCTYVCMCMHQLPGCFKLPGLGFRVLGLGRHSFWLGVQLLVQPSGCIWDLRRGAVWRSNTERSNSSTISKTLNRPNPKKPSSSKDLKPNSATSPTTAYTYNLSQIPTTQLNGSYNVLQLERFL